MDNRRTLYIRETGPVSASTLVFLHGGGVGGWMWQPVVDQLLDYHCLVPDLPEHGHSIDVKPYSLPDAAARVAELIRTRAHGRRAHVVGLSLGAQTIVQLLSTSPEVVERAMISGTLVRPLPGMSLVKATAKMYMPFRNIDFLIRANMKGFDIPAQFFPQFKEDTRLMTADSFTHMTVENMRFRIPPGLERANVPTLVLVGAKERKVMHASAHDLLVVLPNATGRVAPRLGHNWCLENPDLFAQTVRAWINGQPLPQELQPLKM
jgi:pimeloyl-ACP methyl ester carboxylesterase